MQTKKPLLPQVPKVKKKQYCLAELEKKKVYPTYFFKVEDQE